MLSQPPCLYWLHPSVWDAVSFPYHLSESSSSWYIVACMLSHIWHFVITWAVAHQVLLSVGFSRQEYWSGLSFPTPEDLPDARIEPMFLASPAFAGRFFTTVPPDPLIPFFHEIFCELSCPLIFSTSESLPSTLKHTHPLLIVISKVAPVNRLLRKVERTADHNIRKTLKWKQHPYSSFFLDTPQFCLEAATA